MGIFRLVSDWVGFKKVDSLVKSSAMPTCLRAGTHRQARRHYNGTEIYKLKKSPLSPLYKGGDSMKSPFVKGDIGGFYNTKLCIVLSL